MLSLTQMLLDSPTICYGLVVPMAEESEHILRLLQPMHLFNRPFEGGLYLVPRTLGLRKTTFIVALQCGIGKAAIAGALAWLSSRYHLPLCFHLGTAGTLSKQVKTREWVLAKSTTYHDVDLTGFGYPRGVLPHKNRVGCPDLNLSNHDPFFYARLCAKTEKRFRCHWGSIISGEQFISESNLKANIQMHFPNALAVDMESAAFAQACQTHRIPWLIFRSISDDADSPGARSTFRKNLKPCSEELTHLFFEAIRCIEEASLETLVSD